MEVEVYNYGKAEVLRDGYEGAKSENSANQKSKKKIIHYKSMSGERKGEIPLKDTKRQANSTYCKSHSNIKRYCSSALSLCSSTCI
ncbi:hypothetical protein GOBAR_AA36826 [Gossypium barbadense]|uniref:Uncharacterized protein n=1 Tax=Gossypium barbadense TaxID=3634 RepID=A0A2P5VYG6_GOSBA|nr:hypothetical protein GOBAR_AA36826 [Gossypium barbadense]